MTITDDLTVKLDEVLRRHLRFLRKNQEIHSSAFLNELGLDSVSAVDLLVDLERTFGVTFRDDRLNADTFRTAESLLETLVTLMHE